MICDRNELQLDGLWPRLRAAFILYPRHLKIFENKNSNSDHFIQLVISFIAFHSFSDLGLPTYPTESASGSNKLATKGKAQFSQCDKVYMAYIHVQVTFNHLIIENLHSLRSSAIKYTLTCLKSI